MKNTTAVILMALGLALPATTSGQNSDPASRPAAKRPTQRKMTGSEEARPATPVTAAPVTATPAPAMPATTTPASQRQRSTPLLIAAVDVNHDRVIDAAELAKASEALRKLDKNGDGTLTVEELRPQRSNRPRSLASASAETGVAESAQRAPSRPRLGALDVNKDGVIDASEISGASEVLAKLDKDGDGKVTLDEVRSTRAGTPRAPRTSVRASNE